MLRRITATLTALWLAAVAFLALGASPAAAFEHVATTPPVTAVVAVAASPTTSAVGLEVDTAATAPAFAFTLDPATVVQILVAIVLPVLVGLVTTRVTSGAVKAWLLAGLSLLTSLLVELGRAIAEGVTYDLGVALLAAIPAFVVSVATHYGLWRPTGVTDKVQTVGRHRAQD